MAFSARTAVAPRGGTQPLLEKKMKGLERTFPILLGILALLVALASTALSQTTTGTVSMSATVSKFVELNSGGAITLTGNSGGGITTNGTVLNERGKRILEQLNVGIILSVDSINQETYSKIRLGANFDRVMEHLRYFQKITKEKNTYLSIAACPMTMNWQDIPELLSFCNKEEISLHYNFL